MLQSILDHNQNRGIHIIALDTNRCKRTQNMLSDEPFWSLCTAAEAGKLIIVGGGPMCRTFSVKRLVWMLYGALPCRGRYGSDVWGLPELNKAGRAGDKTKTDNDSVLFLRLLIIMKLAYDSGSLKGGFLEHPEDPATCSKIRGAEWCATIWEIPFVKEIFHSMLAMFVNFDQCQMGQIVKKCTTFATIALLDLSSWHNRRC